MKNTLASIVLRPCLARPDKTTTAAVPPHRSVTRTNGGCRWVWWRTQWLGWNNWEMTWCANYCRLIVKTDSQGSSASRSLSHIPQCNKLHTTIKFEQYHYPVGGFVCTCSVPRLLFAHSSPSHRNAHFLLLCLNSLWLFFAMSNSSTGSNNPERHWTRG